MSGKKDGPQGGKGGRGAPTRIQRGSVQPTTTKNGVQTSKTPKPKPSEGKGGGAKP